MPVLVVVPDFLKKKKIGENPCPTCVSHVFGRHIFLSYPGYKYEYPILI